MSSHSDVPTLATITPVLQGLKPYLHERWGVTELAIFGSVARGEAEPGSDGCQCRYIAATRHKLRS